MLREMHACTGVSYRWSKIIIFSREKTPPGVVIKINHYPEQVRLIQNTPTQNMTKAH